MCGQQKGRVRVYRVQIFAIPGGCVWTSKKGVGVSIRGVPASKEDINGHQIRVCWYLYPIYLAKRHVSKALFYYLVSARKKKMKKKIECL